MMQVQQPSIFDILLPKFALPRKIRIFESFAGIGTQSMAFDDLPIDVEIVGFSEIDQHAIKSYQAIHGSHIKNYGDITKMESIPNCDVFTWSFPCTDLSKAGKKEGLEKGIHSSLGFEVIRLLKNTQNKPLVLLMENVPQLLLDQNKNGWRLIVNELESLGFSNHVEVLNSKHFGVAQNRERVFMVSILGEYSYSFPLKKPLEKTLEDYLETNVDQKYYLTTKQIEQIQSWNAQRDPLEQAVTHDDYSPTITAKSNTSMNSSMLLVKEPKIEKVGKYGPGFAAGYVLDAKGIAPTVMEHHGTQHAIIIPEATKQGYALAEDGDGVYIGRPHQKRGVVQKGMVQTIKANNKDIGVVVRDSMTQMIDENGNVKRYLNSDIADEFNSGDAADLSYPNGYGKGNRVFHKTSPSITVATSKNIVTKSELRIRKFTALECWRLMGINDKYYFKAKNAGVSETQLYKQAGNAIVVDVLKEIFSSMIDLGVNYER